MKKNVCPNCGNDEFHAHQVCRMDVVVNADGEFQSNQFQAAEMSIYDAEQPYGPFVCTKCGAEFEELSELSLPFEKKSKLFVLIDRGSEYNYSCVLVENSTDQTEYVLQAIVKKLRHIETREMFNLKLIMELKNHGFDAKELKCKSIFM